MRRYWNWGFFRTLGGRLTNCVTPCMPLVNADVRFDQRPPVPEKGSIDQRCCPGSSKDNASEPSSPSKLRSSLLWPRLPPPLSSQRRMSWTSRSPLEAGGVAFMAVAAVMLLCLDWLLVVTSVNRRGLFRHER